MFTWPQGGARIGVATTDLRGDTAASIPCASPAVDAGGKEEEHEYVIVPDSGRYREVGMPANGYHPLSRWTSLPSCTSETAQLNWGGLIRTPVFKDGYNRSRRRRRARGRSDAGGKRTSIQVRHPRGMTMKVWITECTPTAAQLEVLAVGVVSLVLAGASKRSGVSNSTPRQIGSLPAVPLFVFFFLGRCPLLHSQ